MLDFNASSERGGGLAAPRVHQQPHGYRYKDGAPVSDIRARRTAVLAAAAKAKSEAKAHAADQAIRRLVRRGEPVVSHAFLYGNPGLRDRIERLRAQACPQPAQASDATSDNTIIQALTSQ